MENCRTVFFLGIFIIPTSYGSLARGKPTTQGSTHSLFHSGRAVDGNYNPEIRANSCAHLLFVDTWWTVDLQSIFVINRVAIYNRNNYKERLDQLYVEGFTGDPYLCPNHSKLCGYHPGPSGDLVNLDCLHNMHARYIRLKGLPEMTLCEVDVFGQAINDCVLPEKWTYEKQAAKRVTESIQIGTASTPSDCLVLCTHRTHHCSIFNFNVVNGSCTIPSRPIRNDLLTTDENWNLYFTC